jgi:hypothetical protein
MKDNLAPFFNKPEELASLIQDPYPEFNDKPADQWNEAFHKLVDEGDYHCKAIPNATDAAIIEHERILIDQLSESPGGQIVEFSKFVDSKTI